MKKKFVMSYSCGKDSTLALYRMIKEGHEPVGLLVTVDEELNRSWFHGIEQRILNDISKSLNIPLIMMKCNGENYEKLFEEVLENSKNSGADSCVFGDIDIENHRKWCSDRCKNSKLEAIFPLWQENREKVTYEFIDSGFKAILKNINLDYLNEEFLGKTLTKELVKDIKETGADPCGENGEYHTFVFDGPIFSFPIEFKTYGNILKDKYGYLDVR
ncbi:diphthine--ammonia ligase [Clostridium ihumii]|uniref:Dph6-related ATP pyrophosphatase n=1 Tax=Clostridium ihumii TaxID=1470356 RepID=UPI00058BC9BC|nr:diphthine--ammonia ligase [Clostridium ihumii]